MLMLMLLMLMLVLMMMMMMLFQASVREGLAFPWTDGLAGRGCVVDETPHAALLSLSLARRTAEQGTPAFSVLCLVRTAAASRAGRARVCRCFLFRTSRRCVDGL